MFNHLHTVYISQFIQNSTNYINLMQKNMQPQHHNIITDTSSNNIINERNSFNHAAHCRSSVCKFMHM